MTKESKSINDTSPEQINQWIKEHQEDKSTEAQDKLVKHYRKLIESLAYKYSKGQSHHEDLV
ncbi:MAG: RNA polymerase sigma factor SigB, partial [Staphylococcus lugdunensis]|nr:RNA polymerase sigma factor SigB [Staphylococcus lugdunensis]